MIEHFKSNGVKLLSIPPRTTGDIQPLDVVFNLQYKLFVKRLTEQARLANITKEVITREGIINFQSLIYNQFSSPAYTDLIKHSWHNTDPEFYRHERRNKPDNVLRIQFGKEPGTKCSVRGCQNLAFTICAWCKRPLCIHHFLNRTCFHTTNSNYNSSTASYDSDEFDDDWSDDDELTFFQPSTGASQSMSNLGMDDLDHDSCY